MDEPQSSPHQARLDELRRALNVHRDDDLSEEQRRLVRLARALAPDEHDETACRLCQERLPEVAAAELRGERIAQLFPEVTAHLDICETCAREYAELLDALLLMEKAVGAPLPAPPPTLAPHLRTAMRLRGWLARVVEPVVKRLQLADAESLAIALETFLEWLPQLPDLAVHRPAQQLAMGFGSDADPVLVLLWAAWGTTARLAERHRSRGLEELAAAGELPAVVRDAAEETVGDLQLDRQVRRRFVEQYVASVERDPAAFMALLTPPE